MMARTRSYVTAVAGTAAGCVSVSWIVLLIPPAATLVMTIAGVPIVVGGLVTAIVRRSSDWLRWTSAGGCVVAVALATPFGVYAQPGSYRTARPVDAAGIHLTFVDGWLPTWFRLSTMRPLIQAEVSTLRTVRASAVFGGLVSGASDALASCDDCRLLGVTQRGIGTVLAEQRGTYVLDGDRALRFGVIRPLWFIYWGCVAVLACVGMARCVRGSNRLI